MRKQYVKVHISGTPIVRHLWECPVALYELSSCRGPRMFRDGQSLQTFLASQEGRCSLAPSLARAVQRRWGLHMTPIPEPIPLNCFPVDLDPCPTDSRMTR